MKRSIILLLACICLWVAVGGCASATEPLPSNTPMNENPQAAIPSDTIEPTASPTQEILYTPTLRHTPDTQMENYMQGVETQLHHGSIPIFSTTASFADACPGYYLGVFPYRSTRGVFSFVLFRLPRLGDGTVDRERQEYLWNWLREGIFPHEYGQIRSLDVVEGWPLMLQWVAKWPNAGWQTGMAYGECPADDFAMIGLFDIQDPDDFVLRVTRFEDQAPFDFWLQEANVLTQYHYASYEAEPLWAMEDTPGQMVAAYWDESSPDFDGDGQPDLVIVWSIDGSDTPMGYLHQHDGFTEYGPVDYP